MRVAFDQLLKKKKERIREVSLMVYKKSRD